LRKLKAEFGQAVFDAHTRYLAKPGRTIPGRILRVYAACTSSPEKNIRGPKYANFPHDLGVQLFKRGRADAILGAAAGLMRLTDRLSQPQKIVVVIALGMAFGAAGMYLVNLGYTAGGGWYAYAPLSQAAYPPDTGLAGWLRLIIWLALIGLGSRNGCPSCLQESAERMVTGVRLLGVAIGAAGASVQPALAGHAVAWTGSATEEASQSRIPCRTSGRPQCGIYLAGK
jgi:hypothetical protein